MDLQNLLDNASSLLEKSSAQEWEALVCRTDGLGVSLRGRELDKFQQSSSLAVALRVVKDKKLGFSYVTGGAENDLGTAVEEALASAESSGLVQEAGLARPGAGYAKPEVFDPAIKEQTLDQRREKALALAEAAFGADERVVHIQPADLREAESRVLLRTSHGLDLEHRSSMVSAACVAMAAQNGEQEVAYEGQAKRFLADLDVEEVGRWAGKRAADSLGGKPEKDGRYSIVLENRVAMEFLDLLANSLLGDNLVKGRSLLAGKEGQKVLAGGLGIIDDGLYPRGLGSASFDDEGTAQATNILVEDGVLQGFVFDRLWGQKAGRQSTGNASRPSLKSPPGVGFTNLYIKPGSRGFEQLLADMGRGILITEIMGGHTADPVSGEFSFGAAGFLVEGGKLGAPVKSMAMAGQIVDFFKSVDAVGADLHFSGGSGSPSLLIRDVSLSGP